MISSSSKVSFSNALGIGNATRTLPVPETGILTGCCESTRTGARVAPREMTETRRASVGTRWR